MAQKSSHDSPCVY